MVSFKHVVSMKAVKIGFWIVLSVQDHSLNLNCWHTVIELMKNKMHQHSAQPSKSTIKCYRAAQANSHKRFLVPILD